MVASKRPDHRKGDRGASSGVRSGDRAEAGRELVDLGVVEIVVC
jgi:hypothetical protein